MRLLFNSVTRSPFKTGSGYTAPHNSTEGISSLLTYCILGLVIAVVLFFIIRIAFSLRKDRKLAEEKTKRDKMFISKILEKKKAEVNDH